MIFFLTEIQIEILLLNDMKFNHRIFPTLTAITENPSKHVRQQHQISSNFQVHLEI
jgi:hypothetical protein